MNKSAVVLLCVLVAGAALAQVPASEAPPLNYRLVPKFLRLPVGINFGEAAGVAVNSKGHIFVFHRGAHPLLEFDAAGAYVRELGEGLFTTPHGLRVDAEDYLWTTDVDSHLVLKLSPEGRVQMVLGKKGTAGEELKPAGGTLFNKPSDVAFDVAGNIYVSDGYGNSRVVKFDKDGKFLKTWGSKGTAPGQFDLPHAIAVDAKGLVYVADRENHRIQIFDGEGNFIREWTHVGYPYGLSFTREQFLYVADGRAGRVLKLDLQGKILGVFGEPGKAAGQFGWAHGIAVGPGEEIYVSEILNWRVQKFVKQ